MGVLQLLDELPEGIARPPSPLWSLLARSLGEQGGAGRTALAWRWALTGGCPSPVTLTLTPGRPPGHAELLSEAAAAAQLARPDADPGGQVMQARCVLEWLVGTTDAAPVRNPAPGELGRPWGSGLGGTGLGGPGLGGSGLGGAGLGGAGLGGSGLGSGGLEGGGAGAAEFESAVFARDRAQIAAARTWALLGRHRYSRGDGPASGGGSPSDGPASGGSPSVGSASVGSASVGSPSGGSPSVGSPSGGSPSGGGPGSGSGRLAFAWAQGTLELLAWAADEGGPAGLAPGPPTLYQVALEVGRGMTGIRLAREARDLARARRVEAVMETFLWLAGWNLQPPVDRHGHGTFEDCPQRTTACACDGAGRCLDGACPACGHARCVHGFTPGELSSPLTG